MADPADAALATKPPAGASPERGQHLVGQPHQGAAARDHRGQPRVRSATSTASRPSARDDANTVALDRDLADWGLLEGQGLLTDDERQWLDNARAADDARDRIEGRVDPVTGEPIESQLYIYDPAAFDGDGAVAISAGNLDTADNVAVVVPGFGTDGESAPYQADRAATIYESTRFLDGTPEQRHDVLDRLRRTRQPALDRRGLGRRRRAHRGRGQRGRGAAGRHDRRAARRPRRRSGPPDDDRPQLRLDHHRPRRPRRRPGDVDDIIFVGSPGVGGDTDHAERHRPRPRHVWAGANSRDPITYLANHGWVHGETLLGAGLGDDPAEDDFGATRFQAESTTRGDQPGLDQHSLYFDHGTESLHNISQIVNGNYDGGQPGRAQLRPVVRRRAGPRARPRPDHPGDPVRQRAGAAADAWRSCAGTRA